MSVYLDNAATTQPCEPAVSAAFLSMVENYGNPSSLHKKGINAEKAITEARKAIASALVCAPECVYFTSGATESNNTAIFGTAQNYGKRRKKIVTTSIEHPSVSQPLKFLEENGFEVVKISPQRNGQIDYQSIIEAVDENTCMVSCMMVNNEIGAIEPIEEIAKIIKAKNPNTIFHVDAIQAYGKLPIVPKNMGIDLLSTSGHKIHGPKGIGFLYIKEGTKISPIIFGGGQQKGMRSGTENVPGIVGLAVACEKMIGKNYENAEKIREVKEYFQERIKEIEDIKDNSGKAPHVASISFKKLRSEVLLHALEDREIYVSSGSACSSNKKQAVSGTLNAIALSDEFKDGTLRFSFSIENTKEEVDETIKALKELVPMLRRFVRK